MLHVNNLIGFGVGGGVVDQYTKILLHFDGSDGSTTITDSGVTGHAFTAGGNGQIDTAISKFGGAALLCDGTGDYVTTPDHADFSLGSSNFTIDLWFNRASGDGTRRFLAGQSDSGGTTYPWLIELSTGNVIRAFVKKATDTLDVSVVGTTTFTATGWHHVALVRTGNTLKLFIDGTQEGGDQTLSVAAFESSDALSVGRAGEYTSNTWNGSIDEFHLSVGIARWTANFTPPTQPYPFD